MTRLGIIGVVLGLMTSSITAGALAQESYSWEEAASESYWYSYYNVDALIRSGLGVPLSEADWTVLQAQLGEEFTPLRRTLVAVPYAMGDPAYVQSGSLEWGDTNVNREVTSEALAWMVIASSVQALQLEYLFKAGLAPRETVRDQARLLGFVAAEAALFVQETLKLPDGLFGPSWSEGAVHDGTVRPRDQIAMLWALAQLVTLAQESSLYQGDVSSLEAELWASELFHAFTRYVRDRPDRVAMLTPRERGWLIEAVAAYAATLADDPELEEAVRLIEQQALALSEQVANENAETTTGFSTADRAAAVRALIVASLMIADGTLEQKALELWTTLDARWDEAAGIYATQGEGASALHTYSVEDVGDLVGAFGAIIDGTGREAAKGRYARFFQSAVKRSGLMASEGDEAGGADGDVVPLPRGAGGPFGIAPVFRSGVRYDANSEAWNLDSRFQTGGALYLAARLAWIGRREGQPYMGPPRYGLPESRAAQFIGLKTQVARLRAERDSSQDIEALKELLQSLEARVEELRKQLRAQGEQGRALQSELTDLGQRVNGQISILDAEMERIEQRLAPPRGGPLTTQDTITLILIVFVLLLGFVAYQWVLRSTRQKTTS